MKTNIKYYFGLFIILGIVITSGCKKVNNALLPLPSIITTPEVVDITAKTATNGGTILTGGGGQITARGVCWKTSSNPTINDNKTVNGTVTGLFKSSITGLSPNTTYYVRAYATNSAGTAYGSEVNFTTYSTMLEGVWSVYTGIDLYEITISGTTGTFSKLNGGSNISAGCAFRNGLISLGSQYLKNITNSGTNKWTCIELLFYGVNTQAVTAAVWSNSGTISMHSDENSFDLSSSGYYNGIPGSNTCTFKR